MVLGMEKKIRSNDQRSTTAKALACIKDLGNQPGPAREKIKDVQQQQREGPAREDTKDAKQRREGPAREEIKDAQQQRKVRFAPKCRRRRIPKVNEKIKADLYYSQDEIRVFSLDYQQEQIDYQQEQHGLVIVFQILAGMSETPSWLLVHI